MSYKVELEKRADRELRKLDPQISGKLLEKIRILREDPHRYPLLSGAFSEFRKIAMGTSGGEYRIVYTIDKKLKSVNVVFIGPRENFYKELQRYLG